MTTIIFNAEGKPVSQSRNLRGLFDWARKAGGVRILQCHVLPAADASYPLTAGAPRSEWVKATRPTGYLVAILANGYRAETWFVCGSHLVDWARERARPRRNSWFSGAGVEILSHYSEWRDIGAEMLRGRA